MVVCHLTGKIFGEFQVLTAASIKIVICEDINLLVSSSTCETLGNLYQTAQCNIPKNCSSDKVLNNLGNRDGIKLCGAEIQAMDYKVSCGKWVYRQCAGVCTEEFTILKSKNCCLLWFCLDCQANYKRKITRTDCMESEIDKIKASVDGNTKVKTTRIS
jgi:hypothetical protein